MEHLKKLTKSKETAQRGGDHQNIRRISLVLDTLAKSDQGLRLGELADLTHLGKATIHRLLGGLTEYGWVEQLEDSGSYVLGLRLLSLAIVAKDRFNLSNLCAPLLREIAEKTKDTVYLSLRSGLESVCVARYEGGFPVKTLTLSVGDRRPLGVGAASLAILAFLKDTEIPYILEQTVNVREQYQITDSTLINAIAIAKQQGYAVNNGMLVSGMSAIGLPIRNASSSPVAAISVAAISSRLDEPRLKEIADLLLGVANEIEKHFLATVSFSAV